jgi:hypothetical protein
VQKHTPNSSSPQRQQPNSSSSPDSTSESAVPSNDSTAQTLGPLKRRAGAPPPSASQVHALQRAIGNRATTHLLRQTAPPAQPVIQRLVGFEVELRQDDGWTVSEDAENTKATDKGTPLVDGQQFQLQAEYSGSKSVLEFVTDAPGLKDATEYETSVGDMIRLGKELDGKKEKEYKSEDFARGHAGHYMHRNPAQNIAGASLQVTVGVPLASIPALFRNLEGIMPKNEQDYYRQSLDRALSAERDLRVSGGHRASDELVGFMVMIQQYLIAGSPKQDKVNFPKGLIKVMARTDFNQMFQILPEADRKFIVDHLQKWIDLMLKGESQPTQMDGNEQVIKPLVSDPGSPNPDMALVTTRQQWLENIPNSDRLTYAGRNEQSDVRFPTKKRTLADVMKDMNQISDQSSEAYKKLLKEYGEIAGSKQVDGAALGSKTLEQKVGEVEPEQQVEQRKKLQDAVKDLYEGLGALGKRMDKVEYTEPGKDGAEPTKKTVDAPILEIRNPPQAGAVGNWKKVMDSIFQAVQDAIENPTTTDQDKVAENVLTDKQQEIRDDFASKKIKEALPVVVEETEQIVED